MKKMRYEARRCRNKNRHEDDPDDLNPIANEVLARFADDNDAGSFAWERVKRLETERVEIHDLRTGKARAYVNAGEFADERLVNVFTLKEAA